MTQRALLILAFLALAPTGAFAHGDEKHFKPNLTLVENHFGRTGDPKNVTRTIEVEMSDEMRFLPDLLEIAQGETVRFVIKNKGETIHELVLGTEPELLEHAALMEKFPEMEHAEPFMAHVPEQSDGEIFWTFDKPGEFHYGCLIPGHFQAGMRGKIVVTPMMPSGEASLTPVPPPQKSVLPDPTTPANLETATPPIEPGAAVLEQVPPTSAVRKKPKKSQRATDVASREGTSPTATEHTSRR
jgi:uncharacterized cupredoxin-like copper-binding protein